MISLLSATALFTAVVAAANPLATINTCPEATVSLTPATVTSQHQVISTCAPITKCFRGICHTALTYHPHTWVSTEIPCAWDGHSLATTTVTDVNDQVLCAEETATLTSVTTLMGKAWWQSRHRNKPIIKTIYTTVIRHKYAAYNKIGPLAIPGYLGSGLCEECLTQSDGKRVQQFDVVECHEDGSSRHCVHYEEAWVSQRAPSKKARVTATATTRQVVSTAGIYSWKFNFVGPPQTITIPAKTVTITVWEAGKQVTQTSQVPQSVETADPVPYWVYVTRECNGPTTFDITTTFTTTLTYHARWHTEHASETKTISPGQDFYWTDNWVSSSKTDVWQTSPTSTPSVAIATSTTSATGTGAPLGYITTTTTSGSVQTTLTIAPSGTISGTVIIVVPTVVASTTATSSATGVTSAASSSLIGGFITTTTTSGSIATTVTIPPSGTTSGTIIVIVPTATSSPAITTAAASSSLISGFITTTTTSGSIATTLTIPPSGTTSGTIIVVVPTATSSPAITTAAPSSSLISGFITTTTTSGSISTTLTIVPSGSISGTIIVVVPTPFTTPLSTTSGSPGFITTTTTSGSVSTTLTIVPSGTASGTIIIVVPTPLSSSLDTTTTASPSLTSSLPTSATFIASLSSTTTTITSDSPSTISIVAPSSTSTPSSTTSYVLLLSTSTTTDILGTLSSSSSSSTQPASLTTSSDIASSSTSSTVIPLTTTTTSDVPITTTTTSSTTTLEIQTTTTTTSSESTTITTSSEIVTSTTTTSSEITTTTTTTTTSALTTTISTTTIPAPIPTLSCDINGYLVQLPNGQSVSSLYRVDIGTGQTTLITNNVGNKVVNALGYNVLDNYLYAYGTGDRTINRIGPDGSSQVIATLPAGVTGIVAGDIDINGQYWITAQGQNYYRIDLAPGSATYAQIIESGATNLATDFSIIDWVALAAAPNVLYAVTSGFAQTQTYLMRFDKTTKQFTNLASYGSIAGNTWGAGYSTADGNIYASDNVSGQIWQFPINGGTPSLQSQGNPTSVNDGARCAYNGSPINP